MCRQIPTKQPIAAKKKKKVQKKKKAKKKQDESCQNNLQFAQYFGEQETSRKAYS